jgi:hypothetical protein
MPHGQNFDHYFQPAIVSEKSFHSIENKRLRPLGINLHDVNVRNTQFFQHLVNGRYFHAFALAFARFVDAQLDSFATLNSGRENTSPPDTAATHSSRPHCARMIPEGA